MLRARFTRSDVFASRDLAYAESEISRAPTYSPRAISLMLRARFTRSDVFASRDLALAYSKHVPGHPVRRARDPVIVPPQRVTAMMSGTGQMQRIRRSQTELCSCRSCLPIHRRRHVERLEQPEQRLVCLLQDGIAAPERPDQTFEFDQRRNREPGCAGIGYRGGHALRPDRMTFHQTNHQTGIEIDQSQDARSCSMSASISAPERWA